MKLEIFIPNNIFSDIPNLREKTVRIANLVRTIYIFNVNSLYIFKYGKRDEELYRLIEFFKIPSYLRKRIFKKEPFFRYTGVAPPIRSNLEESDFMRIAYVLESKGNEALLDAGLKDPIIIKKEKLKKGSLVKILKSGNEWVLAKDQTIGFEVFECDLLKKLEEIKKSNLIIATSRYGEEISLAKIEEMKSKLGKFKAISLLFGSPKEGLFEIFKKMGKSLNEYADYIINFFPNQGVKTIRTDEAIFGTLAILRALKVY